MKTSLRTILPIISASLLGGMPVKLLADSARLARGESIVDRYGSAVAVSGDLAIVGAPDRGGSFNHYGSAYVYDLRTRRRLHLLGASDGIAPDRFGISVAISGELAVIGAYKKRDNTGAAYVFNARTGQELFKLMASDHQPGDEFGVSVAVQGTIALVGAHNEDTQKANQGAAYLFDLATGREIRKLSASDGYRDDHFGNAVALTDRHAIVGASRDNGAGSVYVFDLNSGAQVYHWTAPDSQFGDLFGHSVAAWGNKVLVGAPYEDGGDRNSEPNAGAAYIFDLPTGTFVRKLTATDYRQYDQFGISVSVSETTAVVGAPLQDWGRGNGSDWGAVYVFDVSTGEEVAKLGGLDPNYRFTYGTAVSIDHGNILVGAAGEAAVYLHESRRPDLTLGTRPEGMTGEGIYEETARTQSLSLTSSRLQTVKTWFGIGNDGIFTDSVLVRGSGGNRDFAISYRETSGGISTNTTAATVAGRHRIENLAAGDPPRLVSVEVSPSRHLLKAVSKRIRRGKKFRTVRHQTILQRTCHVQLTATSVIDPSVKDTAKVSTSTR